MTNKITFKKLSGCFLLLLCLTGPSLFTQSHAKTFARGMGGAGDTIAPVITLYTKDTVYFEVFDTYVEFGGIAIDNVDGNITSLMSISGTVNTSMPGPYFIVFTVKDKAGNFAVPKIKVVIVRDTKKPVINNPDADANDEVKVQVVSKFIDKTTVTDNVDNLSLKITDPHGYGVDTRYRGTYTLIYNATDLSGNKADTKTYKYLVDDYVAPVVILNTLDTIIWPLNKAYNPIMASVIDNYYNTQELSLTRTSNVNVFKAGLYYDEYTATDGSGNIGKRRRYVLIEGTIHVAAPALEKEINIYPNPSSGIVNISYNLSGNENTEIEVFNALGLLVANTNVFGQKGVQAIDLGNEANGIYTVIIRTGNGQITRKVSVAR